MRHSTDSSLGSSHTGKPTSLIAHSGRRTRERRTSLVPSPPVVSGCARNHCHSSHSRISHCHPPRANHLLAIAIKTTANIITQRTIVSTTSLHWANARGSCTRRVDWRPSDSNRPSPKFRSLAEWRLIPEPSGSPNFSGQAGGEHPSCSRLEPSAGSPGRPNGASIHREQLPQLWAPQVAVNGP